MKARHENITDCEQQLILRITPEPGKAFTVIRQLTENLEGVIPDVATISTVEVVIDGISHSYPIEFLKALKADLDITES